MEEIVLHAMEREPSNRYSSAAEMKIELDAPETVQLTGRNERLHRATSWKRKFRHVRVALITTLVPIVMFLLLWFILSRQHH